MDIIRAFKWKSMMIYLYENGMSDLRLYADVACDLICVSLHDGLSKTLKSSSPLTLCFIGFNFYDPTKSRDFNIFFFCSSSYEESRKFSWNVDLKVLAATCVNIIQHNEYQTNSTIHFYNKMSTLIDGQISFEFFIFFSAKKSIAPVIGL